MYSNRRSLAAVFGLVILIAALALALPALAGQDDEVEVLEIEVAEDMFRFVFDEAPVFEEDGFPAYGNPFITQGYIYPAGTLTCDDEGVCNGVNPDGSPEFPEKVIGEWTCRGWFVGDGAHTESGPMVITTQIYDLGDEYGETMLVSEGYELVDIGKAVTRAITGGTGAYTGVVGEASQTMLGLNATEGVTLHLKFEIQR